MPDSRPPAALFAVALFGAGPAAAHTPYLAPLNFAPSREVVTVLGGMFEETPLVSDFALRGSGYLETGPDGRTAPVAASVELKGVSAFDAALAGPGTYRLSTGEREGRVTTFAQVDRTWRPVRPASTGGAAAPSGAPRPAGREGAEGPPPLDAVPAVALTVKSVSVLRAETYVTRGAPSPGALKPTGRGLEFAPETNPNAVFLDAPFAFRLLVDGRPVAGVAVLARRADEAYAERKTQVTVTTGADGRALLKAPLAGVYVLAAKYPAATAPGGRPAERTYVSTVTVEVTP